jgi:hypothetical protein
VFDSPGNSVGNSAFGGESMSAVGDSMRSSGGGSAMQGSAGRSLGVGSFGASVGGVSISTPAFSAPSSVGSNATLSYLGLPRDFLDDSQATFENGEPDDDNNGGEVDDDESLWE